MGVIVAARQGDKVTLPTGDPTTLLPDVQVLLAYIRLQFTSSLFSTWLVHVSSIKSRDIRGRIGRDMVRGELRNEIMSKLEEENNPSEKRGTL